MGQVGSVHRACGGGEFARSLVGRSGLLCYVHGLSFSMKNPSAAADGVGGVHNIGFSVNKLNTIYGWA